MNNSEARQVLLEHLACYRTKSYAELLALLTAKQVDTLEVRGPSGTDYQLEFEFFWDAKPGGDIRVWGTIDDGRWRAFCPLVESFILSPQEAFVGE